LVRTVASIRPRKPRSDRVEVVEDVLPERLPHVVAVGVGGERRVEADLEQAHQLLGDGRVRREGVVHVGRRERRAHPLPVEAIGAKDADLLVVETRGDDEAAQAVGSGLATKHGGDGPRGALA
jgi:hypothetical protein